MYIDFATMIAIMIALVTSTSALIYSIYVIRNMDNIITRLQILNKHIRSENANR
jgi:hypothetical protein